MTEQQQPARRQGREGARWINQRPTPEEFGEWFKENVKIHDGLDAEDYVGGIVLIPVEDDKAKYVSGFNNQGQPVIGRRAELAFVPYAKVETRVNYFWDLMELKSQDWFGVIEPIEVNRPDATPVASQERVLDGDRITERDTSRVPATAQIVEQLPAGFGLLPVPVGGQFTHFLTCSYRCAIYAKDNPERPIREGRGTKMVPLVLGRATFYADQNSIMKAETGAIGRALGTAGIFVIPGSGVATAEDMIEQAGAQPTAQQADIEAAPETTGPAAPVEAPVREPATAAEQQASEHDELVQKARALVNEAYANFPGVLDTFREWGAQRTPPVTNLGNLTGAKLRGAVRKLERLLDDARQAAAARAAEPGDEDNADARTDAKPPEPETAPEPAAEPKPESDAPAE